MDNKEKAKLKAPHDLKSNKAINLPEG